MNKVFLILVLALLVSFQSYSQWESNFGIGIENPQYALDVDGDINISSGHQFLLDGEPVFWNNLWKINSDSNLTTNTKIGIGNPNPQVLVDISDSTETQRTFVKLHNKSVGINSSVNLRLLAGSNGSFTSLSHLSETYNGSSKSYQADFGQLWTSGAGLMLRASGGILRLETSEYGTPYERMRIDTKGYVGINTKEPTEQLEVNGNVLISRNNSLILTSPNGTKFKIKVNDDGSLSTNMLTTNTDINSITTDVEIYPNPTEDLLNIQVRGDKVNIVNSEVFDLNGRQILQKRNQSNKFQISMATLSSGSYIIKIKDQNGNLLKSEKFIKK